MFTIQASSNQARTAISTLVTVLLQSAAAMVSTKAPDIVKIREEILGTKNTRNGARPGDEACAKIDKVIAHYVSLQQPIPLVVPWGSEKPNGGGPDLAEVMAIKAMEELNRRVTELYPQGLVFNIRLEDASAPHLFYYRMEQARKDARHYTDCFVALTRVLSVDHIVRPWVESQHTTEELFNAKADEYLPTFENYVHALYMQTDTSAVEAELSKWGWRNGCISKTTVEFYLNCYSHNYPDMTLQQHLHIMSRYFAAALARRTLHLTGAEKEWGDNYLQFDFGNPGRGTSPTRIHYRTIPRNYTSGHIPPWRAKGYIKIEGGEPIPKLCTFRDERTFTPGIVTLTSGTETVSVQADMLEA